jgi:hypothetical protein
VGLVEHRGRVWCAVADKVAGRVSLLSRVKGPWQVEAPVEVVASGSAARVVVDGLSHCMVPTGRARGGTVVDLVYSDEQKAGARAPEQPGMTTTSGVS